MRCLFKHLTPWLAHACSDASYHCCYARPPKAACNRRHSTGTICGPGQPTVCHLAGCPRTPLSLKGIFSCASFPPQALGGNATALRGDAGSSRRRKGLGSGLWNQDEGKEARSQSPKGRNSLGDGGLLGGLRGRFGRCHRVKEPSCRRRKELGLGRL